ncbi:hypothetical protein NliqN6_2650 [Naganishia liquefaciens]|uniref:Uncharacterized protein n=1 Tax=Naganishia liquefaciens TaxID=104408 RepID=A0A8H3TSD0_9TREE|nr:hypothetical protein NliqN6_2650 [Naganishia liquefaciens]
MGQSDGIRLLGNYERYSLARDNTGNPQLITYVGTYALGSKIPLPQSLKLRAGKLIGKYPLLKGCILDVKTTVPKWRYRSDGEVVSGLDTLVKDEHLDNQSSVEDVIARELDNNEELRVSANNTFLWRIVRYTTSSSDQPGYLAVTLNHVISDGKSGLALFDALLNETADAQTSNEATFPPSLENTVDTRPGYRYMANVIWTELIVPKLPTYIAASVRQAPCWPGRPPAVRNALRCYKHIILDSATTASLKANGKRHRVNTLHPILETAAVVALWITFGATEIAHNTPMSVRDVSRGHPLMTGNYVSNLENRCSIRGEDDFWEKSCAFSTWLKSDVAQRQAISAMGMLAHIPDGINDLALDSSTPTGWESFLKDKMARSPSTSLEVSNLGYTGLPPCVQGVTFAQTPSPATPVVVNAVGTPNGLSLLVCWRDGAYGQDGLDVGDFAQVYETVLGFLAQPELEIDEARDIRYHPTFADIRRKAGIKR